MLSLVLAAAAASATPAPPQLATATAAQAALAETARGTADRLLRAGQVPGAQIAVVRAGRLVEQFGYGKASVQLNVPMSESVRFELASVTKVFSGVALLRLEQEGRLRLDDPVSRYVPNLPPAWQNVRLSELAAHTSGLPDVIDDPNRPLSAEELRRTEEQALSQAEKRAPESPPGVAFKYDQTNYLLIKKVIARASGREFHDFMREAVFAGVMPDVVWGDGRAIVPRRVDMYTALNGDKIENGAALYQYPSYLDAAGGLNATIGDMARFAIALTGGQMLRQNELARMWAPARDRGGHLIDLSKDFGVSGTFSPAIGWFIADNSGGRYPRAFMTGGSSTVMLCLPKQLTCVIVLTNLQAKDDPLHLAEAIARKYVAGLVPMFD